MSKLIVLSIAISISTLAYSHGDTEKKDQIFTTTTLQPNINLVAGSGGNILIIDGEDGATMIDDGYEKDKDALNHFLVDEKKVPKFIINTHWHGDHTGSNQALGSSSTIIAHKNVRVRLSTPQEIPFFKKKFEAQTKPALPVITYEKEMNLYVNGQDMRLVYYPDGHTDSDTVIFLQPANIIHLGDLYFSNMFPFVDASSKGSVNNIISYLKEILTKIDDKTTVVPGHGKVSNKTELLEYIAMLEASVNLAKAHKTAGLDLTQAQEKGLPKNMITKWGNGFIKPDAWMQILYDTM